MDIQKSNNGYQKIDFWISKNLAEFWISIIRFMDIKKSIFGYPEINFWISKIILDIHNYFFISQNILLDIQK